MDDIIRIGIVGLGWVSTHRHIPALRKDPRYKIVGVADRNGDLSKEWGQRLGVQYCAANSIKDIDWIESADAIDIATAPMAHYELVHSALSLGKHVITEKPFTLSEKEGETLVALAEEKQRSLAIVHNFQFAPAMRLLEKDISSGKIGSIRAVIATQWGNPKRRLPTWYDTLPGGLFYDESPHLLYLVRRLAPGPLRFVSADSCASTLGHETPASIDARFRSNAPAGEIPVTVSFRFESPISEWHVAVLGDKAAGIVDVFRNIYLRLQNDGEHQAPQVIRTSMSATWGHWWQHLKNGPMHLAGRLLYGNEIVFSRFADSIVRGIQPDGISARDALDVLKMQWDILGDCQHKSNSEFTSQENP